MADPTSLAQAAPPPDITPTDTGWKGLAQKSMQDTEEEKKFAEPYIKSIGDKTKKLEELKYPSAGNAPKAEDYQHPTIESFGSAANWLAVFGSLMTRRPLINALNASAGVMQAANQRDEKVFKTAYDKWKTDHEEAVKAIDFEQKNLSESMKGDKTAIDAHAAATKNDVLTQMRAAGMEVHYVENMNNNNAKFKNSDPFVTKIVDARTKTVQAESKEKNYNDLIAKGQTPEQADKNSDWLSELDAAATKQQLTSAYSKKGSGVDEGILNQAENSFGSERRMELAGGHINVKNQEKIIGELHSAKNLEDMAAFVKEEPRILGIYSEIMKKANIDSVNSEQKIDEYISSGKLSDPNLAAKIKILNKMVTTQALADAAAAGTRGATVYTDKQFRSIYDTNSSPQAFVGVLEKRLKDANEGLKPYNLNLDNPDRKDKDQYPFFNMGAKKYFDRTSSNNGQISDSSDRAKKVEIGGETYWRDTKTGKVYDNEELK